MPFRKEVFAPSGRRVLGPFRHLLSIRAGKLHTDSSEIQQKGSARAGWLEDAGGVHSGRKYNCSSVHLVFDHQRANAQIGLLVMYKNCHGNRELSRFLHIRCHLT